MQPYTLCKTVHQYNKTPVPKEDMDKLIEIAKDYNKVKNYVYQRYGGIKSLPKIYPGYTVQNEITQTALRKQLGLPSVYFYLAIFDALGDIKSHWTQIKAHVLMNIQANENFSPAEKHYLRFVIKQSLCFEGILLGKELELDGEIRKTFESVCSGLETKRLDRYLSRQVRRHLKKLHTDIETGFSIAERAYRYGEHGIYITTKERRKRIFVPLTDRNQYKKQMYIKLDPSAGRLSIHAPVEMQIKQHKEYKKEVGLAIGMTVMLATDTGNQYGKDFGKFQFQLTDYMRKAQIAYGQNRYYNPGRKKYEAKKKRLEATLHTYVNMEINRMLKIEQPRTLYLPKFSSNLRAGKNREINYALALWQRGYVRSRIKQKCVEHSIEIVEVYSKNISNECCQCRMHGIKRDQQFSCKSCGLEIPEKTNTAVNVLNRGREKTKNFV